MVSLCLLFHADLLWSVLFDLAEEETDLFTSFSYPTSIDYFFYTCQSVQAR